MVKLRLLFPQPTRAARRFLRTFEPRYKAMALVGKDDHEFTRYINLNYTDAEKSDARMYQPGLAIQFSQNLKGIAAGSIWKVKDANR